MNMQKLFVSLFIAVALLCIIAALVIPHPLHSKTLGALAILTIVLGSKVAGFFKRTA